jgi:type IV pilus assembly protein PilC
MIIALSEHLISFWYVDLISLFIVVALFIFFKHNAFVLKIKNKAIEIFLSKIPLVKDIHLSWHMERWIKIVSMSVDSGISIAQALSFAGDSVNDMKAKRQFQRVCDSVSKGHTCAASLRLLDTPLYAKIRDWESIIDSGEKTGKFGEVFDICHTTIKEGLFNAFDRFQRMVEPALIIFVGIIVLVICISIILPMYQLTQSLQ